jgi:hypothetical protein
MADRQAQIPGGGYFNDAEEATLRQAQIPGGMYVNETQEIAGEAPAAPRLRTIQSALQW